MLYQNCISEKEDACEKQASWTGSMVFSGNSGVFPAPSYAGLACYRTQTLNNFYTPSSLQEENNALIEEKLELLGKLEQLRKEKEDLFEKYELLKNNSQSSTLPLSRKRLRRKKKDIKNVLKCPRENCDRYYGTIGSIVQHVRIKHPEFQTEEAYLHFIEKIKETKPKGIWYQSKKRSNKTNLQKRKQDCMHA